jgi:stage V sporulation protein G
VFAVMRFRVRLRESFRPFDRITSRLSVFGSFTSLLTSELPMTPSDIRIYLCPHVTRPDARGGRLRAYAAVTFDGCFVVRDLKLIEGDDGLFVAMPSRKIAGHCPACSEKNHLLAKFCNECGCPLPAVSGDSPRGKLHADIAHPVNAAARRGLERDLIEAYSDELRRSKLPGYAAPHDADTVRPLAS